MTGYEHSNATCLCPCGHEQTCNACGFCDGDEPLQQCPVCDLPCYDDQEVREHVMDSHTMQERFDAFKQKSKIEDEG